MYREMSRIEKDQSRAEVFERLAESELRHASRWAEKLGLDTSNLEPARADLKLRVLRLAARALGTGRVLPIMLHGEAKYLAAYSLDAELKDLAREERHHARLLREMTEGSDPLAAMRSETRHRFGNGSSLRAAVLGVNDGLISNFSLVMGVAGGTSKSEYVLLAGVAGLLAGAFSMAAGEYISMRSQRDVYEYQIKLEQAEIEDSPEDEVEELVLIYRSKGFTQEESEVIAKRIMERPDVALDTMVREELGLDPSQLGSPWGASLSSFLAFTAGANRAHSSIFIQRRKASGHPQRYI